MRRSIRLAVAAAILMLAFPIASVQAAPPMAVHFDIQTGLDPDGNGGPFVATGAAVDAGLICPSGDTVDVFGRMTPGRPAVALPGVNFHVFKAFFCADESGAFLLMLQARVDQRGDNFSWVVVDAIGDYVGLLGAGQGYGIFIPGGVNDILDGKIHF